MKFFDTQKVVLVVCCGVAFSSVELSAVAKDCIMRQDLAIRWVTRQPLKIVL